MTTEETAKESSENTINCPLCGSTISSEHSHEGIAYEDKQEFVRCLLANKPFVKRYALYDNQLIFSFHSLSSKQAFALKSIGSPSKYDIRHLKLAFYLEEYPGININSYNLESFSTQDAEVKKLEVLTEPAIALLSAKLVEFLYLEKALVEEGFFSNFTKQTAGAI